MTRQGIPQLPFSKLLLAFVTAIGLSSCSTNVLIDQSMFDEGIFVLNSRKAHENATTRDAEGNVIPKSLVKFKQLGADPQLRFRGRLANPRSQAGPGGKLRVGTIRSLSFEEFHASAAEKRALKLENEPVTFREAVEGTESLTIFVHGFNNSVRDVAKQTIELKQELHKQGSNSAIMFYTWPTSSSFFQVVVGGAIRRVTLGKGDAILNDVYLSDRKNIDIAAHALYSLYEELSREYPNLTIDMIAHSMGSEVVLKSFLLWHYHRMIANERSIEQTRVIRRVVLVGADIGIDLFKVLAGPSSLTAQDIMVYVNPRDAVLEESSKLNDQSRVGSAALDRPLPGITEQFTFVNLRDPLVPVGPNIVRQFLVNHNPLTDVRVLQHACRFVQTGQIVESTLEMHVHEQTGGNFRGSRAAYYQLHFKNDDLEQAVDAITLPIQKLPGHVLNAADAVRKSVPSPAGRHSGGDHEH